MASNRVADTERKIIETARRMFAENGYQKTNMSDIAQEVGINRPTLHYYYRTKDKMFEAVFADLVRSFLPRIEFITTENSSLEQKIERITDEYVAVYRENPYLPQFILGEVQRDSEGLLKVMEEFGLGNFLASLRTMLEREAEAGNARKVDPRFVVMSFFGQMTFPFLTQNVVKRSCDERGEGFDEFIAQWRDSVVRQMRALLLKNM